VDALRLELTARKLIPFRAKTSVKHMLQRGNALKPYLGLPHVSSSTRLKYSCHSPSSSSSFSSGGIHLRLRPEPSPRHLLDLQSRLHKYSCLILTDCRSTRQNSVNARFAINKSPTLHYYRLVMSFASDVFIPLSSRLGRVPSPCSMSASGSLGK
jgi:hypothetical protein